MNDRERYQALMRLRLEQAEETLNDAKTLLDLGRLRGTINRAYYAMFYAVQALMVPTGQGTSKHQGAIAFFDREFVRTGKFDKGFSKWLHDSFDLRLLMDYSFKDESVSTERASEVVDHAGLFVSEVKRFCENQPE